VVEQANPSNTALSDPRLVADRRAVVRYPTELEVSCYPLAGGPSERRRAWVRNLSCLGVGLFAKRRWERGTVLVLDLPTLHPAAPNTLFAHVVHASSLGDHFLIGCFLQEQLTDEALQAILQGAAASSALTDTIPNTNTPLAT
jgi:hypothetical protein